MTKARLHAAAAVLAIAGGVSLPCASGQSLDIDMLPPVSWLEKYLPEELPPLKYPEYADALDRVQMQIRTGRYRLALQNLRSVPQDQRGIILTAQALLETGQYPEAQQLLANPALQQDARSALMMAHALAGQGSRAQAIELLKAAIEQFPGDSQLRLELAMLQDSVGQLSAVHETLAWFDEQKFINRWRSGELRSLEDADELVTIARALDHLAILTGKYRDDLALHHDLLAMFVQAYDIIDRRNVDAHVAAAKFFLDHDDDDSAAEELGRALSLNPNHVRAWLLAGELALGQYDFDRCEQAIAAIRKVNDQHPAAAILTARLQLLQRMPEQARKTIKPLVAADPHNAELLALLAACEALTFDSDRLASILEEIDRIMPESSLAHTTAANYLIPAFQFKDAARLLHVAVERTPHWNFPRNLLALAYMQQVDMEKARPILEEARKLDPFNVQTTNYLRLLDTLESYTIAESDHFMVRYSPRYDPFLAQEVLDYMESHYPRIVKAFAHEPQEKTIIELMPTSEDFAVRTTGKPWIGTIGASTGPVITMVSPRSFGKTNGAFDWCDVTRHEFVHTVTLDATHHRIPRWFTEGLAVAEQTSPLNHEQAMRLSQAVLNGQLFPIRRLNWAFVRPQRRGDQALAYAQSLWLCTYIQETFGYGKILELFAHYRNGLSTEEAISRALGMSTPQLDAKFAAWAAERIVKMGLDEISQKQLKLLKEQGKELIESARYQEALEVWERAYGICPGDLEVNRRLAGLYLHRSINLPEKAAEHLHALDREQLHDNRYAKRLAKLYEQQKSLDEAIKCALRATQIDPYDADAREMLSRLYEKSGQEQLSRRQQEIAQTIQSLRKSTARR